MQHDDVVFAYKFDHRCDVSSERRLVVPTFRCAERASIARGAIQVIVNPLRDLKEPRVAFDDDPTGIHARAPRIREQCLEQLGDAPARRRRIHIQHGAAFQGRARRRGRSFEPGRALRTNQPAKPTKHHGSNIDFLQRHLDPGLRRRFVPQE